jgi:hypothetical protein
VVDVVFDAFAASARPLVAWLAATGAAIAWRPFTPPSRAGRRPGRRRRRPASGRAEAIGRMVSAVVVPALGDVLDRRRTSAALGPTEACANHRDASKPEKKMTNVSQVAPSPITLRSLEPDVWAKLSSGPA